MDKPTILVVDDVATNIQVASGILRPHYRVLAASDGHKALELLSRKSDIALVLLDILMPELDGYEVCRRIHADPMTQGIPVIFLSTLQEADDEDKGFAAGGVDFINKPFQPATLLARVGMQMHMIEMRLKIEEMKRKLERKEYVLDGIG